MQEKADLKDRVEELEHRCIQLSGETDTIGKNSQHESKLGNLFIECPGCYFSVKLQVPL